MPSQFSGEALNFKITLLSGNNVVLVDCPGYESELFMPQIVKGRITFQNIIPNHRCCDTAAANVQTGQLILPACKLGDVRITSTPQRLIHEHAGNVSIPLARSTPSSASFVKSISRAGKENVVQLLTPELLRCRPASTHSANIEFLETSSSTSHLQSLDFAPNNDSEASVVNSPPRPTSSVTLAAKTTDAALCNFMHKAPPVRTYARRKPNTTNPPKAPISWSPLQKKKKSSKVSSTKPPSPRIKLDVRRRKLVVDQKRSLATQKLHNVSSPITKSKIRRTQVTGKTRLQFEALKGTAFDMLTTPGHSYASNGLIKQFQEACVEKYSDTLPNYAELSETTPLQLDRQVKSLIAKEKRLEKQMTKSQQENVIKKKQI